LKLQNDDLIRQRDALKQTTIENKKLREALKIHSSLNENFITVQVSHHTHDGYSQTFYTKVPVDHEIDKNSPVLTTKGYLVGRVVGTHQRLFGKRGLQKKMSQIMPISDPASRIPVKIEGTGDRAILKGKGNNPLELTRIENVSKFKVGQRLVTSGEGGFFPPGVPVAEITKITQGGSSIQARPLGKINDLDLDFVLILPTV
jgi:rod shape-determining protein MreC